MTRSDSDPNVWTVLIEGCPRAGITYAYRVDGSPNHFELGHRFDVNKPVLDPYAPLVCVWVWVWVWVVGRIQNPDHDPRSPTTPVILTRTPRTLTSGHPIITLIAPSFIPLTQTLTLTLI